MSDCIKYKFLHIEIYNFKVFESTISKSNFQFLLTLTNNLNKDSHTINIWVFTVDD